MRVAVVTCPEIPVPPRDYGGTEMQVDVLCRRLSLAGHDVTLLCGPGSECPVSKVVSSRASASAEWEHVAWLRKNVKSLDAVLDFTMLHLPSQSSGLPDGSPTAAFMYGDPFRKYPHDQVRNRVYLSETFAKFCGCPNHPYTGMIVHDNPESIPPADSVGDYALFVGTVRPEKGIHLAASACRSLGVRLLVAGPVQPKYKPYLHSIGDSIEYVGPVGLSDKWDLYRGARVLVFPATWFEAGPLVTKEAMLVGRPFVSYRVGSVVEDATPDTAVMVDVGGDYCSALEGAMSAEWDAAAIRRFALGRVSVDGYVGRVGEVIRSVAGGISW